TSHLARDRLAYAQGLERAKRGRWQTGRRHVSLASGAAGQRPRRSAAVADARRVDEELSAAGIVRRTRQTPTRTRGVSPARGSPHGRLALCEWRSAAPDAGITRLSLL